MIDDFEDSDTLKVEDSPTLLRSEVTYNPSTGLFVWGTAGRARFKSDKSFKTWNTVYSGKPAFTVDNGIGYLFSRFLGRRIYAHRAAFFCMTGEWPADEVDHINGNPSDNRWNNLRLADHAKNLRNVKKRSDNSSGYKGVSFNRNARKFEAYITLRGKRKHLGFFSKPDEAYAVYCAAALEMHEEFARVA